MAINNAVFNYDPLTGITEYINVADDGAIDITAVQELDPVLEGNQEVRKEFDARARWKGDMHRVASIPLVLYYQLKKKGIIDDPKAFKKWLNDPDNKMFRTREGKV